MVHQGEQRVQMSYQRAWSTFTLKTLVGTFIFWRREAVKPCSSANGSLTPGQLKKPYARTLTQHQSGALSHVKGATWIRMHSSLNGSLCSHKKGLCQFQPGFPLWGNVLWLNWWHGVFPHPCQNQWVTGQKRWANTPTPTPTYKLYTGGHHTHRSPLQHVHGSKYTRTFWQRQEGNKSTQLKSD